MEKPRSTYIALTETQIADWREALTRTYRPENNGGHAIPEFTTALAHVNTLCDMAVSSLHYAEEIHSWVFPMNKTTPVVIAEEGLLAAERHLREHCEEYENGTPLGSHSNFIRNLLSLALRASGIEPQMPPLLPYQPSEIAGADRHAIP